MLTEILNHCRKDCNRYGIVASGDLIYTISVLTILAYLKMHCEAGLLQVADRVRLTDVHRLTQFSCVLILVHLYFQIANVPLVY